MPLIGITMGDPAGIGPEIICKAFYLSEITEDLRPFVIGDIKVIEMTLMSLNLPLKIRGLKSVEDSRPSSGLIEIVDLRNIDISLLEIGRPSAMAGRAVVEYIKKAVSLAMERRIHAIVTAPINKETLNMAGFSYPGHTELLAELTGAKDFRMMLIGGPLKVILVTTHVGVKDIAPLIKRDRVLNTIRLAHKTMLDLGIKAPRIAIAGLNPHAGEGGIFGREEIEEIMPTIEEAKNLGIDARGPIPPDTLFHKAYIGEYDIVVAMYHDQGLIPLKMISFGKAVNVTVGLPIIRTSVDHGTAYDIAGKGKADPSSLIEAIKLAARLVESKNGD